MFLAIFYMYSFRIHHMRVIRPKLIFYIHVVWHWCPNNTGNRVFNMLTTAPIVYSSKEFIGIPRTFENQ